MNELTINTLNERETQLLAERLASYLTPGMVITLEGELGVGKTTFTKGIARGLGINEIVTSPTFTIIKEYVSSEIPLYHIDAYRLEGSDEDIGLEDYFYGDGISVIEWAQFIDDLLPDQYLEIMIEYIDGNSRNINFKTDGNNYMEIINQLKTYYKDE